MDRGQAGERLPDHAEIIVHHYEQALELSRAAGETPDLAEALARFLSSRATTPCGSTSARPRPRTACARALDDASVRGVGPRRLGDALQEQGRLQESEQVYEEAIAALQGAGDERGARSRASVWGGRSGATG